ncbi:MAG: TolC family protein [Saprospiraceae bacterium]|nr:TolC family protein [Saprospiraceae bacterium]MCB9324469.1 TolC family protein [Lewinellaceae bacterium]
MFQKAIFFHLILLLWTTSVMAQDFSSLVEKSWNNNEQLKAQHFQLQQAEAALKEARSMYGPTISLGGQYTLAAGGRGIDFPVGDLLNPVYSTLNQLTSSNAFPAVENATISFLPNNFLDARLRIQQPVYYPELAINRQFQSSKIDLKALEIKAYKRLLSKEVMTAYLQWQMAQQAVVIYEKAEALLKEANRTTTSLFENGKALPSAVNRIQSEQASNKAQLIDAKNQEENAWQLLAFLLHERGISRDQVTVGLPELPDMITNNGSREELQQLDVGIEMQHLAVKKEEQFYLPRVGVQIDAGSQDFDFQWKPYALLGVNVEWNIYDFKRHTHKKDQALAAVEAQKQQKSYVQNQLELQSAVAKNNLLAAIDQANTFQPRIQSSQKTYDEVMKKYRTGVANYLELIDAQTQLTIADLSYILARYNAWIKWAELQYVTASYPIN